MFELPEDSKKIFKRNIFDWYINRPNLTSSNGKFAVLEAFCFAEFSRYYYSPCNPKYKENYCHPENLDDEIVEDISRSDYLYPKDIELLSNEKMKFRKAPYVLQHYVPNKETRTEEDAHSVIDNIMDPYGQQEIDEVIDYLTEDIDDSGGEAFETMEAHSTDAGYNNLMSNKLPVISDNIINENIKSLNMKQIEAFIVIHKWSRGYIKSLH